MTAPQDEVTRDPADDRLVDVVAVGGSQAGLTMAWHLQRQGLNFVVLEAGPKLGHVGGGGHRPVPGPVCPRRWPASWTPR